MIRLVNVNSDLFEDPSLNGIVSSAIRLTHKRFDEWQLLAEQPCEEILPYLGGGWIGFPTTPDASAAITPIRLRFYQWQLFHQQE